MGSLDTGHRLWGARCTPFPQEGDQDHWCWARPVLTEVSCSGWWGPLENSLPIGAQVPLTPQEGCQMHLPASSPSFVSFVAIRLLLNTEQASTPAAACDLSLLALAQAGVRSHLLVSRRGCTWGGLCNHLGPGCGSEPCRDGRGLASVPGNSGEGPWAGTHPAVCLPICGLSGTHIV